MQAISSPRSERRRALDAERAPVGYFGRVLDKGKLPISLGMTQSFKYLTSLIVIAAAGCSSDKSTAPDKPAPAPQDVSFIRASSYHGPARLMIAALGAASPTPITPASENVGPAYSWSPDGRSVAYANDTR